MVVLDPNVRPQAIRDPAAFRARLERVIARSHLVKVSEEDVAWLDPGSTTSDAARALLARGASAVLLTRGAAGATVLTDGRQTPIDAVPTKVADTIGAGDAFGGGMLAWWISHGLGREELVDHDLVVEAARFGALVAARTVAQPGASPPQLPASAAGRARAADLDALTAATLEWDQRVDVLGSRPCSSARAPTAPDAVASSACESRRRASSTAAPGRRLGRQHVPALHHVHDALVLDRRRSAPCRST